MHLTIGEKLILVMLGEIHQKLGIENGVNPDFVKAAIRSGCSIALKSKYPEILNVEDIDEQIIFETSNMLEMWNCIEEAWEDFPPETRDKVETTTGIQGRFPGFDGTHESEWISAARFIIDHMGAFERFKGRDLDSHMPSMDAYRRMLLAFEPMRDDLAARKLSAVEVISILTERIQFSIG